MRKTTPYLVREVRAISSTARVDVFCARPDIVSHYSTSGIKFGLEVALIFSAPGMKQGVAL
jgi:hypothetical protein